MIKSTPRDCVVFFGKLRRPDTFFESIKSVPRDFVVFGATKTAAQIEKKLQNRCRAIMPYHLQKITTNFFQSVSIMLIFAKITPDE